MNESIAGGNSTVMECPRCGHRFALSESFRAHFEAEKRAEIAAALQHQQSRQAAESTKREAEIRKEEKDAVRAQLDESTKREAALKAQLQASQKAQQEREAEIRQQEKAVARAQLDESTKRESALKAQLQQETAAREERELVIRQQSAAEAKKQAESQLAEAGKREESLQEQLRNQQATEDELRQTIAREQAERAQQETLIREQARVETEQKYAEQREQDAVEKLRLQRLAEDLQRKLDQGSMEVQGEAFEEVLKERLRSLSPLDRVEDVKKGQAGADLIHTVINDLMQDCGVIVWEAKNTKNWNRQWIDKIKSDAAQSGSQVRVIVSRALPPEVKVFDLVDGVWVSSLEGALPLARALRQQLVETSRMQRAAQGTGTKMEALYSYLTSPLFRDRIQQIFDTYDVMHQQVAKERRAMESQWRAREKHLERMMSTTIEMRSDFEAIIGREMLAVPALELEALPPGAE